jgi:hypothetical protein
MACRLCAEPGLVAEAAPAHPLAVDAITAHVPSDTLMPHLPPNRCVLQRAACALVVMTAACRPSSPPIEPAARDPCTVVPGGAAADTITVALADPWAHGLGETLVWLDCEGTLRPGAALDWRRMPEPGVWRLTLRAGVTFWDGTPLTAADVYHGWVLGEDVRPRPWPIGVPVEQAVRVVDDRTLEVALAWESDSAVRVFADPAFAVLREPGDAYLWPQSTAPYAINRLMSSPDRLVAAPVEAVRGDDLPIVRYLALSMDRRDDVDRSVGLLVTRDRSVVEYAAQAGGYRAIELPWDRVYALVVPGGTVSVAVRDADFAAAVGEGARTAVGPYAWEPSSCPTPEPEPADRSFEAENRVVYRVDDPVARTLAERLVALDRIGVVHDLFSGADRPTAQGLPPRDFDAALAAGTRRAYVLHADLHVYDPCVRMSEWLRAIPWAAARSLREVVLPLVETRGWALVAEGVGPVALDWRGTPYFPFMRRSAR